MKYKARFFYHIYEAKYALNPYLSWGTSEDWHVDTRYHQGFFPLGYRQHNVMRFIKLKEKDVLLHEEDIEVAFEPSSQVRVNSEVVTIKNIIRNLDGSIDYYTDKREYIELNTWDTYFDERKEREELVQNILDNWFDDEEEESVSESIEEKPKTFWQRLFKWKKEDFK